MKDFLKKLLRSQEAASASVSGSEKITRQELETKAIEGAHKAIKEYRRVFERLAEYDRV